MSSTIALGSTWFQPLMLRGAVPCCATQAEADAFFRSAMTRRTRQRNDAANGPLLKGISDQAIDNKVLSLNNDIMDSIMTKVDVTNPSQ